MRRGCASSFVLIAVGWMTACAGTSSSVYRTSNAAAEPFRGTVRIYSTFVPQGAVQVGVVEVDSVETLEAAVNEFERRVAELGGDVGVIDRYSTSHEPVQRMRQEQYTGAIQLRHGPAAADVLPHGPLHRGGGDPAPRRTCHDDWEWALRRRFIVLAFAWLAACGHLDVDHVVTGAPPTGRDEGPVRILMESDAVPPGFREIGLVRARGSGNQANLEAVIAGPQNEARSIGANAVVRVRIDQGSGSVAAIGTAGILMQ